MSQSERTGTEDAAGGSRDSSKHNCRPDEAVVTSSESGNKSFSESGTGKEDGDDEPAGEDGEGQIDV